MTKSFTLAAAEANGQGDDRLPFQVEGDDTQLYAYLPTEGQMVLMLGVITDLAGDADMQTDAAAEVLAVFWELMDAETRTHLRRRLRSREDRFALRDVMNIIEWLTEEAGARPTTPSSGSTSSPGTTGNRSTARARQRASTRSPSPRTGSATSSTPGQSNGSRTAASSTPS